MKSLVQDQSIIRSQRRHSSDSSILKDATALGRSTPQPHMILNKNRTVKESRDTGLHFPCGMDYIRGIMGLISKKRLAAGVADAKSWHLQISTAEPAARIQIVSRGDHPSGFSEAIQ